MDLVISKTTVTGNVLEMRIKHKRDISIPITVSTCNLRCVTHYLYTSASRSWLTELSLPIPNLYVLPPLTYPY